MPLHTNPGKGASYGITASASRAKGYANSDSTTYANSQVNVGGNTTLDIGNDLNIEGGVLNTDKIQGVIGGDMTIESLQDTATYDSDQKNMGFSADLDLAKGTGSSLSVNGGKTNVNADYQTAILRECRRSETYCCALSKQLPLALIEPAS